MVIAIQLCSMDRYNPFEYNKQKEGNNNVVNRQKSYTTKQYTKQNRNVTKSSLLS